VPVDGTRCRFHTRFPVVVPPARISQVTVRSHAPCQLTIKLRINDGVKAGQLGLDRLRLHCAGVPGIACALHLCLTRLTTAITLVAGSSRVTLPPDSLQPVGLTGDESVLDQAAEGFNGFGVLHEYFSFPAKFLFVDLLNLKPALAQLANASGELQIECTLSRLPAGMPQVSEVNLLLGCTPVVNEFPHQTTPLRIEAERREYKVQPGGSRAEHFEITALTDVSGVIQGQNKLRTYRPLFHQQQRGEEGGGFLVRRRPAVVGAGSECYLVLHGTTVDETISIDALATNRRLPLALGPGDISHPTDECPTGVRFRNLAKPTAPVNPPLGSAMEWQLLAHLGLNYRTLARLETLTNVLDLYDLRAHVDQQARQSHRRLVESLKDLRARPATQIAGGVPVRGVAIELTLRDDLFDGEGEMHLFASVIERLFAGYVGLNAFSQLTVIGAGNGDVHRRPALLGERRLI
jgi:type VI secretion system protein ImpG